MVADAVPDGESKKRELRRTFGSFATGVTVVTTVDETGAPIGFTANSFASVSLDPPLLLVCLAKTSSNVGRFATTGRFAVNVLSESQKDISTRFASKTENRFEGVEWRRSRTGVPLIDHAVSWFDCVVDNVVDAGDHVILIGGVVDFHHTERRPLAFLRGHYLNLGLAEEAAESVSHHGGVRVGCVLEHAGSVLLQKTGEGWTLPMTDVGTGFREGRAALESRLTGQGIRADLGLLYSVFDAPDGNATWLIFLGDTASAPKTPELRLFPMDRLPLREIAAEQIRSVLLRFQTESRQSRFGIYVDGALDVGQINPIDRNATSWTRFLAERERQP